MTPMTIRLRALLILAPLVASGSHAVPAPKYLSIQDFEKCLATQDHGSYRSWCMPARPSPNCPAASWRQLKQLEASDQVPDCPAPRAATASPAASTTRSQRLAPGQETKR